MRPNSGQTLATISAGRPQEFAAETAKASGQSKSSVNQHLARAEALGNDLDEVAGTRYRVTARGRSARARRRLKSDGAKLRREVGTILCRPNPPQQSIEQTATALTAALITLLTPKAKDAQPPAAAPGVDAAPQADDEAERHDEYMRRIGEEISGDFATIAQAHRMLGHAAVGALYPDHMNRVELGARLEELRDTANVVYAAMDQALGSLADTYHLHELLRTPLTRAMDAVQGANQ